MDCWKLSDSFTILLSMNPESLEAAFNPWVIAMGGIGAENCPPAGFVMEKRRVRWFELEFIHSGTGYVRSEGQELPARAGTIFFRWPGMVVQGVAPYLCDLVIFDAQWSAQHTNWYRDSPLLHCPADDPRQASGTVPLERQALFRPAVPEPIGAAFGQLRQHYEKTLSHRGLVLRQALLGIILALQDKPEDFPTPHRAGLALVLEHIDANPGQHFTLEELAALACLSPSFFCRLFHKTMGMTPFQYIHHSKMANARRLLVRTNLTVREIASRVGLPNEAYFYTLFKRMEGFSPGEYRKRHGYPV